MSAQVGNGGRITLTRCELFVQVKAKAAKAPVLASVPIAPLAGSDASQFPFLKNLGKVYSRLRWDSIVFEWRPAVGTTTNGIVTYGVRLMEPNTTVVPKTRFDVSALSPVNDHPVWSCSNMRVARDLLQSRMWYGIQDTTVITDVKDLVDVAPGALQYGVESDLAENTLVGEFWISYSVTMDGSRPGN